jgi:glycosyltransferase involved in cell wall biosynthesis
MPDGRIVIVSDYVGGEGAASGGAGHVAYDSYRALRAAGVDVRVVTGFGATPAGEGDFVRSLGGRDLRAGGMIDTARTIYNIDARHALADELASEDAETTIVLLHQWTRYLSPAALGLLGRFRTMIYMHDYFWACPNGAYYDFREARPCDRQPLGLRCLAADCDRNGRAHKAGRILRQAAHRASTRGPADRRLFLHLSGRARETAAPLLPGERHAIVHNPLDMADEAPSAAAAPRYDFGYFGRLEPEKGLLDLIDAADRLQLTGLFVGQGAIEAEIARRPKLDHRAWEPRSAMQAAMRSCRVVVLPSLWPETWGLIVPEAMAAGVKVLVSTRAGSAELVGRFGGGAVFDPALPGDLDRKLEAILLAPSTGMRDFTGLRHALSPVRHAERIVALADAHFGIPLVPARGRSTAPPASALPKPTPA